MRPSFILDRNGDVTLQDQIRKGVIELMRSQAWPVGHRLPSSRTMARLLGVARNTVTIAYQQLVADGHVMARERSGLFVSGDLGTGRMGFGEVAGIAERATQGGVSWSERLPPLPALPEPRPANWQHYPYPFLDGCFDDDLFPVDDWREAASLSLKRRQVSSWSGIADDDAALIEEIRTKILPRRGIYARTDEVLLTFGTHHARVLALDLFCSEGSRVAIEDPGLFELRALIEARRGRWVPQRVDAEGVVTDERLSGCNLVMVTPSHQLPTGATLSLDRRRALLAAAEAHDLIVVEDDFECETNYLDEDFPAMRGMAGGSRVIYMAGLAKVLDPGLRLGFMVADREVIAHLRELRRLSVKQPPPNNQRAAAQFLSLGHYDSMMRRIGREFRARQIALRDALNHYLPRSIAIQPVRGGTTMWVQGPDGLDVADLAAAADRRGVLIERVDPYYSGPAPPGLFRLGVTSLPTGRIRPGVAALTAALNDVMAKKVEPPPILTGRALRRKMSGARLECRTIYGDPCTISLLPDGTMTGCAGHADEDCDTGRWWIEGDRWHRQWRSWSYGEATSFEVAVEGDVIQWLGAGQRVVDWALIGRISDLAPS
ncbi:PLP-dependent aminotransferase family protein [Sphingopyxis sp.]|jgi:GntR family transcriptional regulator/MocR family aminotransferase|uniref:aminotransferase-like domain-containing protein n=1 Tax=Sphingopyxis sp. TaxID=1908224 RepID=UPI00311F2886